MMPAYDIQYVANTTGAQLVIHNCDVPIRRLATDSRTLIPGPGTLFFAIRGPHQDGHRYLQDCYRKGVRSFILEDDACIAGLDENQLAQCNILLSQHSVGSLQALAAAHRAAYHFPVCGITGSNGKTIIKEWLYQLLNADINIVRSPKSYNSQTGVPLSIWQMGEAHELALIEAGISQKGEMVKLEKLIKPTVGIISNIGSAHSAGFDSLEEKAAEKLLLFKDSAKLIYCSDHTPITIALHNLIEENYFRPDISLTAWSREGDTQAQYAVTQKSDNKVQVIGPVGACNFILPFADAASLENAIHCIIFLLEMGYEAHIIQHRLLQLHPIEMRLELKEGIHNCTIINDSYNSDLNSLAIALDKLNQQRQHSKTTLILSDILESGRNDESLYKEVMQLLEQKQTGRLIGIGPAIHAFNLDHGGSFESYPGTHDFLKQFDFSQFHNEAILLKGSRPFGFEAIAAHLQQKTHNTVLEINLNALVNNLNVYRSLLKPGTRIMAMVKAGSYGSGAHEIANLLQFHKTDHLAVAYTDEGIYLRENGITLPIMVMNPEESTFNQLLRHRLEPEIYSMKLLKAFAVAADKETAYPVHIKIESGMHRLGFMPEEAAAVASYISAAPNLKVLSVFSHLASADVPAHDAFTATQLEKFKYACGILEQGLGYGFIRHILNSAGIARFPQEQMDMVRLGIGLYGIDPSENISRQLEEVNTLKTRITQIKYLQTGDTVGYSRKGVASHPTTIATLAIGYADGFLRSLGNGRGHVVINGQYAPTIGNICMDMCMADITGINAREGDEAIIFGAGRPVGELAAEMDTIAYEVLTSISHRVKRVYFHE